VAAAGWSVANNCVLIKKADKDDPDARPAIGVVQTSIPDATNGNILIAGALYGVDTSSWFVTDQLVLGNDGDFLRPPPDEDPFTGEVQNVGSVGRTSPTDGEIQFIPDGMNVVTGSQVFALAGSSGTPSKTNPYVTNEDPRFTKPDNHLTVGPQGCDYTSIKAAVDAAVAGGASLTDPWEIVVYPGTYTEDPITVPQGINLGSFWSNRIDTVYVVANNANEDLFTCAGGTITGLQVSGVTDPTKTLFRIGTVGVVSALHGITIKNASTGVAIENGAVGILTNFSTVLNAPGQGVTTCVSVDGAGSYLAVSAAFFSVPTALLPAYVTNPIQTVISVNNGGFASIANASFSIAYKDATADVILANGGSIVNLLSCDLKNSNNAVHIGSGGADTTVVVQGSSFLNNVLNGKCDSATGTIFVSATSGDFKYSGVAGSVLSGIMQLQSNHTTYLAGLLGYQFNSGNQLELNEWFHDQSSTGLAEPETPVSINSGLDVDVPAGRGYIIQHAPYDDAISVEWAADTLTLNPSTTNYVVYNFATSALAVLGSPPGIESILLATAITDATTIRFLHQTRNVIHNHERSVYEYLLATRDIVLKSGLAATTGTGVRNFEIGSGSYYKTLDIVSYGGSGGDATFSYFYGADGANEIASQTQVDITQYDNSGTLTAMTAGYFRSDTALLTSDGRVSVIYGTAEYATQNEAEVAAAGNTPTFIEPTGIRIARLIIEQGNGIVTIVDERPIAGASGSGGTAITVHGDLAGLGADDHTQYALINGGRAYSGNLDMGSNSVINVNLVDGVDVSSHGSRHNPGAADAVNTGVPIAVQVGSSPAEGTDSSIARSDHQHGVTAGSPVSVGTANSPGSASSVARSDHIHSGLTRGASDFGTFAQKATPTGSDVLLIEDAADSAAKKHVTIGSLPAPVDSTAIHKTTPAEISAMTAKTALVDADVLVLEDSESSWAKRKTSIDDIKNAVVFGAEFDYEESLAESTTTGAWTQKLRLTTASLPVGTYRIGWSCELRGSSNIYQDVRVRVQVNDATTLAQGNIEPKDVNSYYPVGGMSYHTVATPTTLNIDMDYGREGSQTARIRNARLEIWRVS
jgi:hypothetical protein